MPFVLTEDDRRGMTPDEIASLTGDDSEALLAAHGGTPAEEAKPVDEPAAAASGDANADADMPSADDLAELLEDKPPAATAAPAPFKVEGPADYKAERTALRAEKGAIEEKWSNGDLSDAERSAALLEVDDKIDDLLIAHTRAETLRYANQQAAEQTMADAVDGIIKSAKAEGLINYGTDAKAAKQFDGFMSMAIKDPDNAGLSPAELARLAHRSVLAIRGLTEKGVAPVPQPTGNQSPPARRNVPTATLAGLPNAAPTGMDNDALDKFKLLEGDDAEDYLASLPKVEQDRILRAADETAMQHSSSSRNQRRARA